MGKRKAEEIQLCKVFRLPTSHFRFGPLFIQCYNHHVYILHEKYLLAIRDLNKVLSVDSSHSKALYVKSVCHLNLGQSAEAIESISRALIIENNHPEYLYIRAYARFTAGLREDALKDAQRCLELKPGHARCAELLDILESEDGE